LELGAFSVSLTVKDIEASKLFYQKLGFSVFAGNQAQNWLIPTFNPGWDQSARKLGEFEDVRELQRRLRDQGISIITEADESTTGPASFMIADPDGNTILLDQHV